MHAVRTFVLRGRVCNAARSALVATISRGLANGAASQTAGTTVTRGTESAPAGTLRESYRYVAGPATAPTTPAGAYIAYKRGFRPSLAASREIDWLEQGLRLLDPGPEEAGDAMLRAILPDGIPEQPTLRQAIVLAMRANPHTEWGATEIAERLAMNGWAPRNGEPNKRVSDMANVMIADGQLKRTKTKGIYRLVEPLASAVQRALRPSRTTASVPARRPGRGRQARGSLMPSPASNFSENEGHGPLFTDLEAP